MCSRFLRAFGQLCIYVVYLLVYFFFLPLIVLGLSFIVWRLADVYWCMNTVNKFCVVRNASKYSV